MKNEHSVLFITGRADHGGGPEHLYQLASLVAKHFNVFIAAPKDTPYWQRYVEIVGEMHMLQIPHRKFTFASLKDILSLIKREKISLIHSHGRAAGVYSRLSKAASKCSVLHTPNCPLMRIGYSWPFVWLVEKLLLSLTDRLIAVSESEKRTLTRQFRNCEKLRTIPNGVVIPLRPLASPPPPPSPMRLIHATRFVHQKYSELLFSIDIEIKKRRPNLHYIFDVLGDGPGRDQFEHRVLSMGLNERFLVHGAKPSILPFLSGAFCYVSTSRWEGLPIAVLESMGHGLPVVASDTDGNNDIVNDRNGFLFSLEKPEMAAESIIQLSESSDLWMAKSVLSREEVASKYSVESMATSVEELYYELLRKS